MLARLFAVLVVGAAALTVQGCGPKSTAAKPEQVEIAVNKGGVITYTGSTRINGGCAQIEAFFQKMSAASHGKIKPLPCHEVTAPKKSN